MNLALFILLTVFQTAAPPDTVIVEPDEAVIEVDGTLQFTAKAYDAEGNEIEGTTTRWFVRDEAILTIDDDGLATAHRPGEVRIVAVIQGKPGFATVTVPQLPPASITARLPVEAVLTGTGVPLAVEVRTRFDEVLAEAKVEYKSSDKNIATVDSEGRVVGHQTGEATITAKAGAATTTVNVQVTENPAVSYQIAQNRINVRTGDVVRFRVLAEDEAGEAVSGLRPAWMVGHHGAEIDTEGADGVFVAEEAGEYSVTAVIGPEITRTITVDVEPRTYNARLVKVGRGPISTHHSGDTWAFEGVDGRDYAYIGTFMHDWMKAWDVTDPANPVLTDSLQVDARRINDVKIHPNNRLAIITREGASNRRNGIVLLDLSTPANPTILSEYTETVTGGVQNVWSDGDNELLYA